MLDSNLKIENEKLKKQLALIKETVTSKSYNLGSKFFTEVVINLNNSLYADYTFIGQLNERGNEITTIALCHEGKIIDNFSYELKDTPCENVVGQHVCSYNHDVTKLFPKDELLIKMGIEAYVGVPLFDSKSQPNGILVSLFKKSIEDTALAESILLIFASRASAELEHREINKQLLDAHIELKLKNEEYQSLNEEYLSLNEELQEKNEQLALSEEKFKMLFEQSGTSNSYFNLEGILEYQNNMSAAFIHGSPDDFIGKSIFELFDLKQATIIHNRLQEVKQTKKSKTYESQFVLPSGKKWFRTIYQPVLDTRKQLEGIQMISSEITREKEAELKLIESQKKYSNVVETATDLITIVDKKGNLIFVNHASEKVFGIAPKDCIGLNAYDFIHPNDREDTEKEFQKWIASTESNFSFENRQVNNDGTVRHMLWSVYLNRDKEGEIIDITSIARDITERKQIEKELLQSKADLEKNQELLKKTGQMAKVGGWEMDIVTNERIFSDEMFRIFDLPIGKMLKSDEIINFIAVEYREQIIEAFESTVKYASPYDITIEILTAKGNRKWVRTLGFPVKENNKVVKVRGTLQDITKEKEFEEQLQLAKFKAEESDRLKTAFLANMSHEIRTPMNGILGFTDLLVKDDLTNEKRQYYVDIIQSSTQQLLNIISDIIDISKIEAEEFTLSETTFSIEEFYREILEQSGILLKQKKKTHIRLILENTDKVTQITTDKNRLSQIILNLVTNAIKFTDEGYIKLSCQKVRGNGIKFSVKDTGIGIEKKMHDVIFKRFRQVDDNTFETGTGLGLSICKALVEKMGGEINIESELGKGSEFYFTINQGDKEIETQEKNEFKDTTLINRRAKILIAEDEEINYLYIHEILNSEKFELLHAENGKIAVELFKQYKPDIVLMDIKMPVMNGYEALKEIQKLNTQTPILAVTAYAMASDEKKALKAGFKQYLSKPVAKEKLWAAINQYL